jgi:lipopolysaccharide export system permease protein
MKLIHRYIWRIGLRNLAVALLVLTTLFLAVDFFDRIDNIASEDASFGTVFLYFLLKIPFIVNTLIPIAMLMATLFTIGLLSKNSELTAMRASGIPVFQIALPLLKLAALLSVISIILGETLVPYATRRTKEIYNIDIQKKDETGDFSQSNFWWRDGERFFSADIFDSRDNTLHDVSILDLDEEFRIRTRYETKQINWLDDLLRWSMQDVETYRFRLGKASVTHERSLPVKIRENPQDFYNIKTDPDTMSFIELRKFIRKQHDNGLATTGYYTDLYDKFSFPLITIVVTIVILPFSMFPARSGSLAVPLIAGIGIAFAYYAVHSLSIALGRAEIWPPLLAALAANLLMLGVGIVLNLGAESPS